MTSPTEARDYVNEEILRILTDTAVVTLLGYEPIIYWQGASYNDTQTPLISVFISHNQVRSDIMAIGHRMIRYTKVVIIELKVPTSTVNALDKIEALADYIEKELSISININSEVRMWQARITNDGVEDSHFCITLSQSYTFNDDLQTRVIDTRV